MFCEPLIPLPMSRGTINSFVEEIVCERFFGITVCALTSFNYSIEFRSQFIRMYRNPPQASQNCSIRFGSPME